jgi:hypothetical protein
LEDVVSNFITPKGVPLQRSASFVISAIFADAYCTINWNDAELVAPPDEPFTVIVYVPFGVPGLLVVLEPPPHETSQSMKKASTTMNPKMRIPLRARFRAPAVTTIPKAPGRSAA